MDLIFATNNAHKLYEIQHLFEIKAPLLLNKYSLKSLNDIGFLEELPETSDTLQGNALEKASCLRAKTALSCFADDTGLEIDSLHGAPGVYSARYAGENVSFDDNVNKVLKEMNGFINRKARFRTVICLILQDQKFFFEGIVDGEILTEKRGKKGFGYDPVFKPVSSDLTFAEMDITEKNMISHRGLAFQKLLDFLLKT
jgi:XTP/dITP diphosphohydrolase